MSSRASVEAGTGASSDRGVSIRSALESALAYHFVDPELLVNALSHRSWCAEHGGPSNERLEFLGDAVLGFLVAEWTYRRHPEQPEGHLAKIRASVVNARAVADTARIVSLGEALLLGRGEAEGGGRDKDSILSDALEAVLGAVYLDGGHEAASRLVGDLFAGAIDRAAAAPGVSDYKTRLQELTVHRSGDAPALRADRRGSGPRQAVPRNGGGCGRGVRTGLGHFQEARRAGGGPAGLPGP